MPKGFRHFDCPWPPARKGSPAAYSSEEDFGEGDFIPNLEDDIDFGGNPASQERRASIEDLDS
jgi:hypothetical protein